MADNLVLGDTSLLLAGLAAFLSFVAGAACSAILVNWARRKRLQSEYALPLMFEAMLLICFGLLGRILIATTMPERLNSIVIFVAVPPLVLVPTLVSAVVVTPVIPAMPPRGRGPPTPERRWWRAVVAAHAVAPL